MKRFYPLLEQFWRPILIGCLLALATFMILFMHLGSRPPLLSAPEVATRASSASLHTIWHNPIDAPLTIPEHFFIHLRPHGIAASRLASVLFSIAALVLFFVIVRFWQNTSTALIGTVMFGTSAWFLHVARLDSPDVLWFSVLGLLACGLWLKHTLHRNLLLLVAAIAVGVSAYIPGLIWFAVAGAIGARRTIKHELGHIKNATKLVALVLGAAILLPMGWAVARQHSLLWTVLGLPQHVPPAHELLKNLGRIPLNLFVRGPLEPAHWLGRVPVLDIFEIVMLVLGCYAFWHYRQLDRSRLLIGGALIGILLITSGGPVNLTILIPLIYITIAVGTFYLLETWLGVFPRNPVARGVGVAVLLAAVAISCFFQYTSYFVAWQHAPATHAVFTSHPVQL